MKRFNIKVDTNVVVNTDCDRCPRQELRHTDKDGLCKKIKSVVDDLPLRCVGDWANDKIYYLLQYFQIFAKGMSKKWSKLRYVEICSGPGRCSTRDGKEQDGTALSIIKNEMFDLLGDAIFIDHSPTVVDLLSRRIRKVGKECQAHAVVGDYNDPKSIVDLLNKYSPKSLTLCFIDPTDCSVPFDAIAHIVKATQGRCDFLISFFDGLDFHRNAVNATLNASFEKLRLKYSRFLGTPDFFSRKEIVEAALANKYSDLSYMFRQHYADKLNALGLCYQDWKPIKNFYHLLYASSNSKGLDFWKKATKYDPIGQPEFELGM